MPYKCNKCRLDGVPNMASVWSAIWPATDTSSHVPLLMCGRDNYLDTNMFSGPTIQTEYNANY